MPGEIHFCVGCCSAQSPRVAGQTVFGLSQPASAGRLRRRAAKLWPARTPGSCASQCWIAGRDCPWALVFDCVLKTKAAVGAQVPVTRAGRVVWPTARSLQAVSGTSPSRKVIAGWKGRRPRAAAPSASRALSRPQWRPPDAAGRAPRTYLGAPPGGKLKPGGPSRVGRGPGRRPAGPAYHAGPA